MALCTMVVVLFTYSVPAEASPPQAYGNVADRMQQIRTLFPRNSHFGATSNSCGVSHARCTPVDTFCNCSLRGALVRLGYTRAQANAVDWSYTCAAFARYVWYYIFGTHWDTQGFDRPRNGRLLAPGESPRAGDIYYFEGSGGRHWAVYASSSYGRPRFIQSNVGITNIVTHQTEFDDKTRPFVGIMRSTRYDEANLHTITFDANGGSVIPSTARTNVNGKLLRTQIPTPTHNQNRRFLGWFTSSGATGGTQLTIDTVHQFNRTYWARWG